MLEPAFKFWEFSGKTSKGIHALLAGTPHSTSKATEIVVKPEKRRMKKYSHLSTRKKLTTHAILMDAIKERCITPFDVFL